MAFISTPVPVASNGRTSPLWAPRMSAGTSRRAAERLSRRTALGLLATVGLGALGAQAAQAATKADKKLLDGELKKLDYEDELFDVGPEKESKLKIDEKRVAEVPQYEKDEKALLAKEENKYKAMEATEEAEAERIRKLYAKK